MTLPPGHTLESWAEALALRAAECARDAATTIMSTRGGREWLETATTLHTAAIAADRAAKQIGHYRATTRYNR